jgi:hypothetical protein
MIAVAFWQSHKENWVNDLKGIISQLERQRTAIDRALSALQQVTGAAEAKASTGGSTDHQQTTQTKRKGRLTPAGRRRLSEAMKKRWAAKRAAEASSRTVSRKRR